MNFLKKIFSKKKVRKIQGKKEKLKKLAFSKIKKIEKEKFSEKTFNKFSFIFEIFIKKIFGIKNHLTNEEIISNLKTKKIKKEIKNKIINLFLEINELEFSNKKLKKEKFKEMILKFKEIINSV